MHRVFYIDREERKQRNLHERKGGGGGEKNKNNKKQGKNENEKIGYTLYFRSNRSLTGSGTSEREFGSTSP